MPYKVMHVLGSLLPGGAELALLRILSNWQDKNFSFSVCYTRDFDRLKPSFENLDVPAIPLKWRNERDFYRIPMLSGLFRRERPHIVHTHLWTGNYWIIAAARLAGVPVVIETIHDSFRQTAAGLILHKILRPVFSLFIDRTIYVGSGVKSYILDKYIQSAGKAVVIYNGIEPEAPHYDTTADMRHITPDVSEDKPVCITIANLRPVKKGYEVYIDALKVLSERNSRDFHAVIIGESLPDFHGFLDDLKKMTVDYNLEKNVTFLGFRPDIHELLTASDICVMPSIYEGGPIVVLEAMRAGKPVVATRTGAVSEYVVDGETGYLVEPGDSRALADALEKMLGQPEKWKQMGELGRERFLENFTIDKTVNSLTGLYYDLLEKKRAADGDKSKK
ncbi:glycosyltransferase [candidate division KSB1 bacterium]